MARRRFTESKSLPSFMSFRPSRVAPRPSRVAPRPPRAVKRRGADGERQFFKCFFHTGNGGSVAVPRASGQDER